MKIEAWGNGNTQNLVEAKHSETNTLPSVDDIKDGLVKMILFTNLENVKVAGKSYSLVAVLKLTTKTGFDEKKLKPSQRETLAKLKKEAEFNDFKLQLL
ncbi:hypothetical protein GX441_00060 [bacterium]|nr:hypothetical protein [bacterium]